MAKTLGRIIIFNYNYCSQKFSSSNSTNESNDGMKRVVRSRIIEYAKMWIYQGKAVVHRVEGGWLSICTESVPR